MPPQIIGEGAAGVRRCGDDLGGAMPLGDMAGLRNRIPHDYDGVDWGVVEEVVFHDLPELVAEPARVVDERGIERVGDVPRRCRDRPRPHANHKHS